METLSWLVSIAAWVGVWYVFSHYSARRWWPWARHTVGIFIGMIISGVVMQALEPSRPAQSQTNMASTEVVASTPVSAPISLQEQFEATRQQAARDYERAPNEIKKSAVFNRANVAAKNIVARDRFVARGWQGTVSSLTTDQGGNYAFLVVKSGFNSRVKYMTVNNTAFGDETAIKKGTALYRTLSDIAEGDRVVFTGRFLRYPQRLIAEMSLTEYGSLSDPEFRVRFQDIRKVE